MNRFKMTGSANSIQTGYLDISGEFLKGVKCVKGDFNDLFKTGEEEYRTPQMKPRGIKPPKA